MGWPVTATNSSGLILNRYGLRLYPQLCLLISDSPAHQPRFADQSRINSIGDWSAKLEVIHPGPRFRLRRHENSCRREGPSENLIICRLDYAHFLKKLIVGLKIFMVSLYSSDFAKPVSRWWIRVWHGWVTRAWGMMGEHSLILHWALRLKVGPSWD